MSVRFFGKSPAIRIVFCVLIVLLCLGLLCGIAVIGISEYVKFSQEDRIFDSIADISSREGVDCVVVLGAGLKSDGTPSHMLEDRIIVGVDIFEATDADYILMSGDCSSVYYDEPGAMKKYALELGVDDEKILIDNEGFSTLESITRVKEEYGFDNIIVITQKYHLYRALYIAEDCGVDAVGVSADLRSYTIQIKRDIREIFARVKDFLMCI